MDSNQPRNRNGYWTTSSGVLHLDITFFSDFTMIIILMQNVFSDRSKIQKFSCMPKLQGWEDKILKVLYNQMVYWNRSFLNQGHSHQTFPYCKVNIRKEIWLSYDEQESWMFTRWCQCVIVDERHTPSIQRAERSSRYPSGPIPSIMVQRCSRIPKESTISLFQCHWQTNYFQLKPKDAWSELILVFEHLQQLLHIVKWSRIKSWRWFHDKTAEDRNR